MNALIIGFGEVGRAHWENLKEAYPDTLYYKDIAPEIYNTKGEPVGDLIDPCDILMVATQCDPKDMSKFIQMVVDYDAKFTPWIIDILTTTPPGTAEQIQKILGDRVKVCKSTIRGTHPNLSKFKCIPKHIGGPGNIALKKFYEKCGWECVLEETSRTTEFLHVANNILYGISVLAAGEIAKAARYYAVDYNRVMAYGETNNYGFTKAGFASRVRPILYPPGERVGGHCVTYATTTLEDEALGPMMKMLRDYGK